MKSNPSSLASRAMGAGAWTVGTRLISKLIDLAMLLCLARYLGPGEFGVVAAAMAVVLIVEALFEMPIGSALIRMPTIDAEMLHTAFSISCARGIIIAALLVLLAWPLAAFSGEPRLRLLLPVLALAPVARGMVSPRMVEYARAFNFKPDAILELSGKSLAFIAAVGIAAITNSYWAIAAATICGPLVATTVSYLIAPLAPKITFSQWKLFSNLIGWNFLSQLCMALNWQVDRLLLPRLTTITAFGQYAMARQMAELPIQALIQPLVRPAMTALSSAKENLASRYLQLSHGVVLIMIPVLGVLVFWPEVVIRVALGSPWLHAAVWLKWLGAISMLDLSALLMAPLAITLDQTRWLAIRTFFELMLRLPLIWIGVVISGIAGSIIGSAVATAIVAIAGLLIIRRMTNITLRSQLVNMMTPFIALVPAGAMLYYTQPTVMHAASLLNVIGLAIIFGFLYALLYIFILFSTWWFRGAPAGLEHFIFYSLKSRVSSSGVPLLFSSSDTRDSN
ncbi:MAG: oligosaccharide flippase family protein [Janthinobacterium lividum]